MRLSHCRYDDHDRDDGSCNDCNDSDDHNNSNYSLIRDDPNIHQPGATLRKNEYSLTPWEEFNLANAGFDISHTQLSRPLP